MSVIAHEMGHSMGLRHNFTGTWDSLNYHTEYWQLRTRNGQEHACPDATTPHTDGTDCVGPRWVDPVTDAETNGLIWKWASTTVMDYPGDQTQDMNDIGSYDKAAMRFGYANVVDVEKSMKYTQLQDGTAAGSGIDYIQALDGFGGIWGRLDRPEPLQPVRRQVQHPRQVLVARRLDGRPEGSARAAVQRSGPRLRRRARHEDGAQVRLRGPSVASGPRRELRGRPAGRVRHPYMFGSDEFAYGNLPSLRFDSGADSYEQAQFLISTYENRYIFNNFRRDRVTFNTGDTVNRVVGRYWEGLTWITKALALGVELLSQPGNDPTQVAGSLMPAALGSADALSMFVRAMTRPAPGNYVITGAGVGTPNQWGGAWQLGDQNSETPPSSPVNIGLGSGEGRFIHNDYDYTKGYWWADYQVQVGSFYEKFIAPAMLTEAYNSFVSNSEDDYVDGRYKNLSYMSLYPNQIRRVFANLMATNSATQIDQQGAVAQIFTSAPYAMPASTANAANPITQAQYLPWDKYDPADDATMSLQYPKDAVLLDPLVGWEEQYPALINLFWFGPTALNMDLIDQMRIFSPGDAASLSIPADQMVKYRDPLTGIEYVAKNYGTEWVNPSLGFPVAKSIGARMLQHANYLAGLAYQTSGSPDPVTGELTYLTDSTGAALPTGTPAGQNAATFLKGYAANVDTVRQLTLFFGYGPLGH